VQVLLELVKDDENSVPSGNPLTMAQGGNALR
jgi:hypothetical protein